MLLTRCLALSGVCLLSACLAGIDTSLIEEDGAADSAAADLDGPNRDGPRPDGPRPDGIPDAPPGSEPRLDLPPNFCTSWSDWSCSTKVKNAVGRCPKEGIQYFSLVCNVSGCSCTRVGVASKGCSVSGQTCTEVQQSFNAGCCAGL